MGSNLYKRLYIYENVSLRHVRKRKIAVFHIGVSNAAIQTYKFNKIYDVH